MAKNISESLGFSQEEMASVEADARSDIFDPIDPDLPDTEDESNEPVQEQTYISSEVHELAKNDLDFLAGMAGPTTFEYCFPTVFLSVWSWLLTYIHKTRDFSSLALGLPRGFGKTTLMKLFILYCILFTDRKFILVISKTSTKAEAIISDVIDMLNEPNIKRVFGDWSLGAETDNQKLKKFGFRGRNIILAAMGVEGDLRGMNLKNSRPDVMIFEDVQSSEDADSEQVSDKIEKWMLGTAMKAKSPKGCMYLFVANMYPTPWSILRRLKSNPSWIKFIAGGILSDGTSLWEELQPIEQLISEFDRDMAAGRPEIFYSEVLNDENASANNIIDFAKLPAYPFSDDDEVAGKGIIIDPSGNKTSSDATSIGYFEVHNGKPVLREVLEGQLSPGDTIRETIKMCLRTGTRLVAIESNAYQASLCYWSNFICQQMGIVGIEFVEVYSGSQSKNTRILSMMKSYKAGDIYIHQDARAAAHMQMMMFNPLKTNNTDGVLDLLTYMYKVIEMYGEFLISFNILNEQEFSNAKVIEHNSSF